MMKMPRQGFTLIELMIVIAIIAIIAAIAIPGILQATRSGNERNAAESIRALGTNCELFKNQHSSNRYWVGDVYGLFDIKPRADGAVPVGGMKISEKSVCNADGAPISRAINPLNSGLGPGASWEVYFDTSMAPSASPDAKSGYLFRVLSEYEENVSGVLTYLRYDTEGATITWLNPGRWGYLAYPQNYGGGGRLCFKNESQTTGRVYKRDPGTTPTFAAADTYSRWEQDPLVTGWAKSD